MNNKDLSSSLEDYLERILLLSDQDGGARVSDIAAAMDVKMPSVIKAIQELKRLNLVEQEPYGAVELTEAGRKAASQVHARHRLLKEFLLLLGVSDPVAERDCCIMEHFLSKETLTRITQFVKQQKADS